MLTAIHELPMRPEAASPARRSPGPGGKFESSTVQQSFCDDGEGWSATQQGGPVGQ